jgi:hypothetical protein
MGSGSQRLKHMGLGGFRMAVLDKYVATARKRFLCRRTYVNVQSGDIQNPAQGLTGTAAGNGPGKG